MNQRKEKISIVIPALNEEKFLTECLKSLKNQNYQGQYEIIVADNGSTDGTISIAKNYGVKIVSCHEIKSVFYARNIGANVVKGNIIVQADADTIYPKNFIKRLNEQFILHPKVVAIAGRFKYRKNAPWWAFIEYFLRHNINKITPILLGRPLVISAATFAFQKNAFLAVHGYGDINYSPDQYGIAKKLSKVGEVIYDENILVLTSPRSIYGKSFLLILWEGALHVIKYGNYLRQQVLSSLEKQSEKLFWRRLTVKSLSVTIAIIFIAFLSYGYFIPESSVFGKVYSEAETKEKVVALTFDDGPNEPYTSEILDILEKYNIKATFFLIGKNVEEYPETAKRIVADGDVIGNHSYSHHANHALTMEGCKDLTLAQKTIFNIVGVEPHLYRPPHGKKSPWEIECVDKENLAETQWSDSASELHSFLFFGKASATSVESDIIEDVGPGKIILLHDGYGICHNCKESDKSLTVNSLPNIIETLQKQGYKFVTVPELLSINAYNKIKP